MRTFSPGGEQTSLLFYMSAVCRAVSLPLLSQHLQTHVSLCKSSVRSGPGKSCATLTQ